MFHWRDALGGAAGVRNRLSSPERLMVASRCFIIFSKCKFVHGVQVRGEGGAGPQAGGVLVYKRTFCFSLAGVAGKDGSSRGPESRILDCRRQFMVLPRPTDQLAP